MDYYKKYLKYRQKYISLKKENDINSLGGSIKQKYLSLKGGANCNVGCPNEVSVVCPVCNFKKYCSAACQEADLPRHNQYCINIKNINDKINEIITRESDAYRLLYSAFVPSARERLTRNLAVGAIKSFYNVLNKKFDYSEKSDRPAWEQKYPGWHRFPLHPDIHNIKLIPADAVDDTDNIKRLYEQARVIPIPLFNKRLDLTFSYIPDDVTLNMECTAAFYMTQFAIIQTLKSTFLEKILNICILDRMIDYYRAQGKRLPGGYNIEIELEQIQGNINNGNLKHSEYDEINNILFNRKKAQRFYVIMQYLLLLFKSGGNQFVKIGDGCGINGHPEYNTSWGAYAN